MSALRIAALALATLLLAACPSKGSSSQPTGPSPNLGKTTNTKTTGPTRKPAPVEGEKCRDEPCMFHPGTGEHHECLNAGGGDCFQYGKRCTPQSACMLDGSGVYRKCLEAGSGTCARFGDPCEAGKCAFDASQRGYRECSAWSGGKCTRYGAPCTPAS